MSATLFLIFDRRIRLGVFVPTVAPIPAFSGENRDSGKIWGGVQIGTGGAYGEARVALPFCFVEKQNMPP